MTVKTFFSTIIKESSSARRVKDSPRFNYIDLSSIFDVKTAEFRTLVCPRRTDEGILKDPTHYNRETMLKVAAIIMASVNTV